MFFYSASSSGCNEDSAFCGSYQNNNNSSSSVNNHSNQMSSRSASRKAKVSFNCDDTYDNMPKLTKKKEKYVQEVITDKNGTFNFIENPQEYKKARK